MRWQKFSGPEEAAEACARHIISILAETLSRQEFATFAVSGGATPKLLFQRLASSGFPLNRTHLFWVDERCVPPRDAQSNFRLAEDNLIAPARIPSRHVHRIQGELMPDPAARNYADEIRQFFRLAPGEMPRFDMAQCGMGADAHTASLLPGEPLIENRNSIAAAVYAESLKQWRVTLLPGVLLAAKHLAFLVSGTEKSEAVRAVFQGEYDPLRYPAQIASRHEQVAWFLDEAAARELE